MKAEALSLAPPLLSPSLPAQFSMSRQVVDFPPLFPERDRCMNARQPLKVVFVVFSFSAPAPSLPPQVVSALESNPTARRTQLHHKFEQVIALVEDNIYECCSEA